MKLFTLLLLLIATSLHAQDAQTILSKIDQNLSSTNRVFNSTMTVHGKRSSRVITSKNYEVGVQKSFSEYLSPAAEKGTKMLKLGSQLWIYSPSTDRIIHISGHMLRQSVMGSDLSYEDMMDDRKLSDIYTPTIIGTEKVGDRQATVLLLSAKVDDIAYFSQKLWADLDRFVPLKQELYGKSGQILKRVELTDVVYKQGRWFPQTFIYKDVLKEGRGTEFHIENIVFDQPIPDHIFSKASLKQ